MTSFFHALFRPSCTQAIFSIASAVLWPYVAGGSVLIVGLALAAAKHDLRQARGLEKILVFGPLLFAIPMAIFGADHLTAAKFVAMAVPSWIPGHLFWAYFVGVALISAALSLATKIQWRLGAAMLGSMTFLSVMLIHIPTCLATPHDKTRPTILLRDLALSAGAWAFAVSQTERGLAPSAEGRVRGLRARTLGPRLITGARFIVAIAIAVFGIDHFLYPTFAPGIPQENGAVFVTMPPWVPGHVVWAYLTGATFVACALGRMIRERARIAAAVLGLTVLVLILLVYIPLTVAQASDIANGLNYLAIHFALAGAALLLAGALPARAAGDAVAG
jgi:uncharacterized membrane protein